MIWFAVWVTLVLATLVGAALLGLSLWRKGKALLGQLHETTEVLERLESRIAELEALRDDQAAAPVPAPIADAAERERWHAVRTANRAARRERRRRRHDRAYEHWDDVLGTR